MESKIPIPTDNIYKFYALFGLVLFISCIAAFLYVNNSTNELIFNNAIEYQALKSIDNPTPVDVLKKEFIEKRMEIAKVDKKYYEKWLSWFILGSIVMILVGFLIWQFKVQPLQDKMARLQLKKLRLEVDELKGKKPKKRLCGGCHHVKMRK